MDEIVGDRGIRAAAREQAPAIAGGLVWPAEAVREFYLEVAGG
jgi:hypothetical protein